jgi:hypothetical protein
MPLLLLFVALVLLAILASLDGVDSRDGAVTTGGWTSRLVRLTHALPAT